MVSLALLLGSGCAYRVSLASLPSGAQVTLPDGSTIATPSETTLRWKPFSKQEITVRAVGYRPLTIDLRRSEVRLSRYIRDALFRPRTWRGEPRGEIELVLVPEHGGAGTWTADEVP